MLLAHAGLVEGHHAVTHHLAIENLRATGALVVDDRVVDDGDLVTCGGVTAASTWPFGSSSASSRPRWPTRSPSAWSRRSVPPCRSDPASDA